MVNISKIESLIKEKGWKTPYFCTLFEHDRTWISDWKRGRGVPDENMLHQIADTLNTTVDYLTDKSEDKKPQKNKPSPEENGLSEREWLLIESFRKHSPEEQDMLLRAARVESDRLREENM